MFYFIKNQNHNHHTHYITYLSQKFISDMSQQMFILNQALDNIQSLFNLLFILQGLLEDSSEASATNLSLTFIQKTQKSAVFILSIIWDSAHL